MADLAPTMAGITSSVAIASGTIAPDTLAPDAIYAVSMAPGASASGTGALIANIQSHGNCVFPLEVFKMIVERLPSSSDLKEMRAVSKPANALATPLLFRTVHLGYSHHTIDVAYDMIKRFGQHILTIVIDPTKYDHMQRTTYNEIVKKRLEPTNRYVDRIKHSAMGHKIRADKKAEMDEIDRKAEIPISLMSALNGCTNIQRVVVQARFELKLTTAELSTVCPDADLCKLTQDEHRAFYTEPDLVWSSPNMGCNLFNGILEAMSKSKEEIKELAIRCDTGDVAIDPVMFEMGERAMMLASKSFQRLGKLQLTINSSILRHPANSIAWRNKKVARLLSRAVNLDTLMLSVEIPKGETLLSSPISEQTVSVLESMLLECQFPKLRRLFLGNVTTKAVEMVKFLESLDKLENLVIEGCLIQDGSWVEIAEFVRGKAGFVDVSLNRLYGDFVKPNEIMVWGDHFAQWEHFFQGEGPNPFTKEQLELYRKAFKDRSPRLKSPPGKDPKFLAAEWFGELKKGRTGA